MNHKNHIIEWLELARTGSTLKLLALCDLVKRGKLDDSIWTKPMVEIVDCFACQEAYDNNYDDGPDPTEYRCCHCPITKWKSSDENPRQFRCEKDITSYYYKWLHSDDVLERRMWAMQIAFMEWE